MESNINYWIQKRGYKKKWIAQQLEVSDVVFSRWINGKNLPSLKKAFLLADILNCKVDDLYTWEESE